MRTYDSYKDSGIDWLGEIPSHWEIEKGKWLFIKQERPVFNHYEVITCFRDGQVTLRKNRREDGFTNSLKEIGYQGILKGDLVIHQMDAFAGAIGVSDSNGKSTPVYSVCTPRKNNVNNYYYAYLLRSMALSGVILSLAKGIRERSTDFRFNDFSGLSYPLPPLPEQEAIARFLDDKCAKIDELVAIKEQQIDKLKELRQVKIHQAVTKGINPNVEMKDSGIDWIGEIPKHWEVKRFTQNLKFQEGPGIMAIDFQDTGIPLIRISGVKTNKVTLEGCNFLDPIKVKMKWNHFKTNIGDLVISGSASTDLISEIQEDTQGSILYTGLIRLFDFSKHIDKSFLKYFIVSDLFKTQIELLKTGSTISHFGPSHLQKMVLITPPLSEQEAIVAYLEQETTKIDQAIAQREAQIEKLKAYKQSLINEVVTGKIRVA